MKPVAFDYHRPETVPEAAALLAELREDAAVLSGGIDRKSTRLNSSHT